MPHRVHTNQNVSVCQFCLQIFAERALWKQQLHLQALHYSVFIPAVDFVILLIKENTDGVLATRYNRSPMIPFENANLKMNPLLQKHSDRKNLQ